MALNEDWQHKIKFTAETQRTQRCFSYFFSVRGRKEINRSPPGKNQQEKTMDLNQLSSKIIGAAIEIHKALGPGLLLNFNMPVMRDGIVRIANHLKE